MSFPISEQKRQQQRSIRAKTAFERNQDLEALRPESDATVSHGQIHVPNVSELVLLS
jgi:hypothetical protein